ncbi:MAG: thioredoxin family protein [Methylomonas sp.]|jgi:glutaredoxin|nr:MAG: thioredoxin family protein [Methylomonas sp.]
MAELILFGTAGCHLCDEAEILLLQAGVSFETRDIMDDEQAQQSYAIRIPVLLHLATGMEIGWPFDAQQLDDFIRSLTWRF